MTTLPLIDELSEPGLLSPTRAGTRAEALTTDRMILQAMLDVEAGLARAQCALGEVPESAVRAITEAADARRFDLTELAVASRKAANPVVAMVRKLTDAVTAIDPAAADFVHRGSTSQDILDTALMLVTAGVLRELDTDLARVAEAAAGLAERYRDTPMAGRTLGLHAVPVTFGLKAAGWLEAVRQVRRRLDAVAGGLPVQLGGAAGTMAGYVEFVRARGGDAAAPYRHADALVDRFAAELGLAAPLLPWQTNRMPMAEVATVLAMVTGVLGKIAADVRSLSRTEVGEVQEPAAEGRGASSAMPHKRNPVLATLVLSAAAQVPLLAATVLQAMVAEDERPAGAWHAEWQPLRECLRLAGGSAETTAELLAGLEVHPERLAANLDATGGQVVSERLTVALTSLVGKLAAKDVMSRVSAAAARTGRPLADVLAEEPEIVAAGAPGQLRALVDPREYLGVAGDLVDRAVRGHRA